eukprot:6182984-Pleurochrysis_carterae.AAC.3
MACHAYSRYPYSMRYLLLRFVHDRVGSRYRESSGPRASSYRRRSQVPYSHSIVFRASRVQAIVKDRIFALADSPWTNLFSEFYVALCPDVRVVLSLRDELEWAQSRKRGHAHSQYGFVCTAAAAQKRRGELIDEQLHSLAESTLTRQGRAHMERSPPPAPNPTHFQTEPKSNVNAKGRNVSWSLGAPPVADPFSYSQCQPQERDGQLVRSAYDFADVDAETLRDAFEQYNEYVRTLVPAAHLLEVNFFRSDQSGAPLVNISAFSRIQEQLVTQFVTPSPPKIWKK